MTSTLNPAPQAPLASGPKGPAPLPRAPLTGGPSVPEAMAPLAHGSNVPAFVATAPLAGGPSDPALLPAAPLPRAAANPAPVVALARTYNDLLAATQRTFGQAVDLQAAGRTIRRTLQHTLPGLALAGASSWGFHTTMTPALLRVSAGALDAAETLRTVPVFGGLFAKVLGAGSHVGLWGGSACLLSATLALLTGKGPLDTRLKWALAHVAQGFALSPFWSMAAAGTLGGAVPGALMAAACTFGVSLVLAQVLAGDRPNWLSGAAVASLTVAGAPLAAQLALGASVAEAAATAGISLAFGALLGTVLVWRSHMVALQDDSTALLRTFEVPNDASCVLDDPKAAGGDPCATIFVDNPSLHEILGSIRQNMALGGSLHNQRLLLCGPPGTGKSDLAKSIQNAFAWPMFNPPASLFTDSERPASKITEIMDQAALEAERRRGPVALVFDEAEKLFPNRANMKEVGTLRGDAAWMMTTTFSDLFEGVGSGRYSNVFVMVITNHPEQTDPAFLSRFSGQRRIFVDVPTPSVMRRIIASRWRSLHGHFAGLKNQFAPFQPDAQMLERLSEACAPKRLQARTAAEQRAMQLTGRDIVECINGALTAANAHFADARAPQEAFETFLRARFEAGLAQQLRDKREALQRTGAQASEGCNERPAMAPEATNTDAHAAPRASAASYMPSFAALRAMLRPGALASTSPSPAADVRASAKNLAARAAQRSAGSESDSEESLSDAYFSVDGFSDEASSDDGASVGNPREGEG